MSTKVAQSTRPIVKASSGRRVPEVPDVARLQAVMDAANGVDQAGVDLRQAVERAAANGHTWRAIGAALGMTAQSAHRKFGPSRADIAG